MGTLIIYNFNKMKQILLIIILFYTIKVNAQNPNAMVCRADRDNTENTGSVYLPKPNEIIKDYYFFTINIDTTEIKTIVPKFVYINCNGCEGENADYRYKLPLTIDPRNTYCENSILDKYGKNILLSAERGIYKQGENYYEKNPLEQNLDHKFESYYHKYPAILEVEINGQLQVLYCTLIDFMGMP